jgi:hypothetical protein
MELILTESQLIQVTKIMKSDTDRISSFETKYNQLSESQKIEFEELFRELNEAPDDVITEAKWWNFLGDVVGIFDPTGVVDIINGLDYIRQGDTFFGMLSMVSAIPYVGDLVAKPIIMAGKGSKLYKTANAAAKVAKTNPAKATKMLESVANSSSISKTLFGKVRTWAPKLKQLIDKIPGGKLSGGLKNTLKDYVSLFEKVGAGTQKASTMIKRAAKNPMTSVEVQNLAKQIKNVVKQDQRLFRDFGGVTAKGLSGIKNYKMSGVPRLFGNKAVRSLMRRTKFWAAFLDWLGVANFVGPDEMINKMGPEQFNEKMNEYTQTQTAQQAWQEDFSGVEDEPMTSEPTSTQQTTAGKAETMAKDVFSDWLFGPISPVVS